MSERRDFYAGVRDVAPVVVGIIPFGLVAGAAAVDAGLSGLQAVGLSVIIFAGASQLAAIELLGEGAPLAVVVGTVLVVNLRMVMYSASIAPYFQGLAGRWKALVAYPLTDQGYALALTTFRERDVSRRAYFLGTAAPLWLVWQACTIVGVVVGARVPPWLPLDFALPLVFLALLVPAIEDASTAAAAGVGGTLATLGAGLPYELGLPLGAVAGVLAGLATAPVARVARGVVS
ncbi:AzlC family ABC transporter permease [Halosegnis sp.]|uniref:AzlC family ABC transporter permease n=1 Tax=Halosegnis sp. TaxID=2864959 RepID=UPI0035D4C250